MLLAAFTLSWFLSYKTMFIVTGNSMLPAILNPSLVVTMPTALRTYEKGDIVMLHNAWGTHSHTLAAKRVVALPGDCIPTESLSPRADAPCRPLQDGYVFVVGDNRVSSLDSRQLGAVSARAVAGTVIVSVPLGWLLN
jgi:type IV secretory pathway protease TraF